MTHTSTPSLSTLRARATAVAAAALVAACGGGGGDTPPASSVPPPTSNPPPTTQRVTGLVVAPDTAPVASTDARSLGTSQRLHALADATCPGVPAGYRPVSSARVSFETASGAASGGDVTTDACGRFDAPTLPLDVAQARVQPGATLAPITVPVSVFADRNADGIPEPVSAWPVGATLEVVGTSLVDRDLRFIVRDSTTRKAVLGLPPTALTVTGPSSAAVVTGPLAYTALGGGNPARVALVLDASGSMDARAGGAGSPTRFQVAGAAARLFTQRMAATDRVGTIAFDSRVALLDATWFTSGWTGRIVDAAGQPVALDLGTDGFTTDKRSLGILADFYNRDSDGWRLATAPVRFTGRSYPWGGSTALWDAIGLGLDRAPVPGSRPFVVAMTDGQNNASTTRLATLVARAKVAQVPIFTIGIGSATSVDSAALAELATASGGAFTRLDSIDVEAGLAGTFEAIRTGIQFQYASTLAADATVGATYTVVVQAGSQRISTPVVAATARPGAATPWVGVFYNTTARAGGDITATLSATATGFTGDWNFTQDPAEPTVLCGAGPVTLTRQGASVTGGFTSADRDPGCGFDAGAVFALDGTLATDGASLSGTYRLSSAGGSTINAGAGVYDLWRSGPTVVWACQGNGVSQGLNVPIAIGVLRGERTVWGQARLREVDARGTPLDCEVEATLIGQRDAATGATQFKLMATGRTGAACASPTATGSALYTGNFAGTRFTATAQAPATGSWNLTCTSGPVSATDPRAAVLAQSRERGAPAR